MSPIRFLAWLTRPHHKQLTNGNRRSAQLFLQLMLLNALFITLGLIVTNIFYTYHSGASIWDEYDAKVVICGIGIILLSFILLRSGLFRTGIFIYISNSLLVALVTPFLPHSEIALLASLMIPILLTAMIFSYKWVAAILTVILIAGFSALLTSSIPFQTLATGFVLMGQQRLQESLLLFSITICRR